MKTGPADYPTYDRTMELTVALNKTICDAGEEYIIILNALITLLAVMGKDSSTTTSDFCRVVAEQLNTLMTGLSMEEHNIQ